MRMAFETMILTGFDVVIIGTVIHSVHGFTNKWRHRLLYLLCGIAGVVITEQLVTNKIILYFWVTLQMFTIVSLYVRSLGIKDLARTILTYFFSFLYVLVMQMVILVILSLTIENMIMDFRLSLIAQLISIVTVIVSTRLLPMKHIRLYMETGNKAFRLIVTISYTLYFGFTLMWHYDQASVIQSMNTAISMVLFALLLNALLMKNALLNKAYKERLDAYDIYLPVISDMVDELRKNQHDYHNHIQTIRMMKASEAYTEEEMDGYIEEIKEQGVWTKLLKMENRILAAFLYSKIGESRKKGVDIQLNLEHYEMSTSLTDYELVEIYGVIIDNAIEATARVLEEEGPKVVKIKITGTEYKNRLEVRNPSTYISTKEIQSFFRRGYSTKEGSQGIGLYKVKQAIEKEKGKISFFYDTAKKQVVAEIEHH